METFAKLRINVSESDHSRGNKNAPLTLVEYGDYECTYCGQAYLATKRIQDEMGEELNFVFRNFPLATLHPHAMNAARAAEAAGLQGKFWEMHDLLFENQGSLDIRSIFNYITTLELDLQRFKIDFKSEQVEKKIEGDLEGATRSGVNGTPCFFVNGYKYDGDWSYPTLIAALLEMRRNLAA